VASLADKEVIHFEAELARLARLLQVCPTPPHGVSMSRLIWPASRARLLEVPPHPLLVLGAIFRQESEEQQIRPHQIVVFQETPTAGP